MRAEGSEHFQPGFLHSWKFCAILLAVYAVCLFSLLARLPLWLDEIIDLHQIRDFDFEGLLNQVPVNAGGVPLSYFLREASIHVLGYSRFSGRLPSLLCCLAACVGIFFLARESKLRNPLTAAILFALTPLQVRYALESRPYAQELALSVWATVVFFALARRPTFPRALLYGAIVLAGLYTQPYMIFVPAAHLIWACTVNRSPVQKRLLLLTASSIAVSGLAFLPWCFWALKLWRHSAQAYQHYETGWRIAPLILHELTGAGYFGTICTVILASVGLAHGLKGRSDQFFWALYVIVPVLLAIAADKIFGYFFAVRQLISILAPLSVLAALGIEWLLEKNRFLALPVGALLIGSFVVGDVQWFSRPHEDWQSASTILKQKLADGGNCILFAPPGSAYLYDFFYLRLREHTCPADLLPFSSILLAASPYSSTAAYTAAKQKLNHGFSQSETFNRQGPRIEVYARNSQQ